MGARLTITFLDDTGEPVSTIYDHSGGDNRADALKTWASFRADLDAISDQRLDDPSYLAAKYVVWAAQGYQRGIDSRLDFLGVGIVPADWSGMGEYAITVRDGEVV